MKIKNALLVFVICAAWPPFALGDEPPIDTQFLRKYSVTRGFSLGRPAAAKPTPDGKAVLFLRATPPSPAMHLFEFDVATKHVRKLLTPEQLLKGAQEKLSPEEKARRERMRITSLGFANFQLSPDGSLVLVSLSGKPYIFVRKDGRIKELPVGKGTLLDPKFSPDGKKVAYVLDADVYVMDLESLKETRVTTGGTEDVSHGLAEFIAQEEMSRFSGYWWSPNSKFIVYEEADARDVEIWRASDPGQPGQEPAPQRYPRPGRNNVKVRLGVVLIAGGETTWIEWDRKKYPYLATVKLEKEGGGPLTILVQSRSQQEAVLLTVNATTGKTFQQVTEKDDAWLNIDQDVPRWVSNGAEFLWTADQEQGPQLELRDHDGSSKRVIFPAEFGYAGLLSVDEKARHVYVAASTDPTATQIFRVSLDGGPPEQLTNEHGLHSGVFSENHALQVRRFSGPRSLPRTTIHRSDGTLIGELPSVAEQPPFVPNTEWVTVSAWDFLDKLELPASLDDVLPRDLHCSITRPRNFDAKKRYPVIVDVYGGPGHQHVVASMGSRFLAQWMADQGFIVVAIDGRGTPRRGRAWERTIRGSFGVIPLDDQVAGLQALGQKYPELDLNRVGITGWSFGGYMSALAVLKRPDVFRAAVAGAPVADWEDYDTHYTERFLGLPQENKEGYKQSSLLTYGKDLKRPLLLIHGTRDDNVFFVHTLKLSDALLRAGKDHEVLPLRGFTHMVPDPQVRVRLEERIVRFFRKHL